MNLVITIAYTGQDLEDEDLAALKEDLEDECRYYGGTGTVEIVRD